jgi:hypothetical protein
MNKNAQERIHWKPIFVIGWVVLTFLSTSILVMQAVPNYLLKMFCAIVALTLAAAVPIHQKHMPPYSIFFMISGIFFL